MPDHARTPTWFRQGLFQSSAQGPPQDHAKASDSISLGSPQDLHTRTCKRPWARSSCHSIKEPLLPEQILQDFGTRTSDEPPTRAFRQAPLRHGICKLLMHRPFREDLTRIFTRPSVKNFSRIKQGPLREEFPRILTRPHYARFYEKVSQTQRVTTWRRRLRASLRNRKARAPRAIVCENLTQKNNPTKSQCTVCVGLYSSTINMPAL